MRVTVSCPEAMLADANDLAMVLAFGPADERTYTNPSWQDAGGNLYAAASFEARDEWVIGAQTSLERPAWDASNAISMAAAVRAQAVLVFSLEPVTALPDKLTAIGGMDGLAALAAMGLTLVEVEI